MGRELRGLRFADLFTAEGWPEIHQLLDGVGANATPLVAGVIGETTDRRELHLELLLLPLKHRSNTQGRLIGSLAALDMPYWAGVRPLARLRIVSIRHLPQEQAVSAEIDLLSPPRRTAASRLRLVPGGRA
jgi:hypothetical protein